MAQLSRRFYLRLISKCSPTTLWQHAAKVWAFPFSLATTWGIIIIFFSSSYLDVSVRRVGFHCWIIHLQCIRLSHSEIYGYNACVQLPVAYRSLPRPSSPLRAKASTIRPLFALKNLKFYRVSPLSNIITTRYYNFISNMSKNLTPTSLKGSKGSS